jgi:HTH-type transcriptional regulator/antitoxin HipB
MSVKRKVKVLRRILKKVMKILEGYLLKQARKNAGITQEELAEKLKTKKSAISRIENHGEDIRLSTLKNYLESLDRKLHIRIL